MSYPTSISLSLLFMMTILQSYGQDLTIRGNQFYMGEASFSMWGLRVASASQSNEHTEKLLAALPNYKRYGVNSVSVYVQGSSGGYSDPFQAGGKAIDEAHLNRLIRIIEACQEYEMVVIVGIFYQRTLAADSLCQLHHKREIFRAVKTLTMALKPYRNVIINIANEQNSAFYKRYTPFNFNDPDNIIRLCKRVKRWDPERIVGGGGYQDSLNILIGKSPYVDVLLFDTFSRDVENGHHSGWHYDHFREMGVPDKPMINVEIFGGWTKQFTPPGVYSEPGKALHTQEIDEAMKRPGLHVHLHSNLWMQGPSGGYPIRYELGGSGADEAPGIRWWFEHLQRALSTQKE